MVGSRVTPLLLALMAVFLIVAPMNARAANQPMLVYTDSLQNGWQNWSWATVNFVATSPVHSGADSIAVTMSAWSGLYLHQTAFDSTPFAAIALWLNGGSTGGQTIQLQATLSGQPQAAYRIGPLAANTWTQVTVPLSTLGVNARPDVDGFWLQDVTGGNQPVFYVDDIQFTASNAVIPPPAPAVVTIDAAANKHAISPLIYGVAYGTSETLADLNAPLNRMGGDNTSRYNWQVNGDNKGSDWFFESIGDTIAVAGERGDTFISESKGAGAEPMLTIPMLPWVAKLGPNRGKLASFSVAKYGAQQSTDSWMPDAGNGVHTSGANVTGNDPSDANVASSPAFQGSWINHIVSKWGTAANNGLRYYIMDNEPSIWFGTHRDVHPIGATMAEIKNDIVAYAATVKAADPSALVVAPEEWGWSGYFYSGYDQQYGSQHGWSDLPDRAANSGADYLPWLLQQMAAAGKTAGKRLLDVFSVHFYPQGGEFGNDTSSTMEILRNRSTRQLWDPNYVSESWIGDKVQLIPRIKGWVSQYYPGTKTAITEYNWGAESSINGATTQADIYGIFGREGLDIATRWTVPDPSTPTYLAMKMYRNYDGNKSTFGETSVSDTVANPDNLSSFASVRADGALTVIVINKTLTGATPVTLNVANFSATSTAQVWQLSSKNAITRLADVAVSSGTITATEPAQTITLFILAPSGTTPVAPKIASLSPAKTGAGGAAFTLALTGTGFTSSAIVKWNGASLPTTYVSTTSLKAAVTDADIANVGSASVTVAQSGVTSSAATFTIADVRPPVTSWALSSSLGGTNGWYRAPVTVALTATDPDSASDVASIQYQIDGGALATYTKPFTFSGDKIHTVTGHSTDKSGNVEPTWTITIKIDATAPVTTLAAKSGTVTLTATDALSGVSTTTYSIDAGAKQTYKAAFAVTAKGSHKVTYQSTDKAGNVEAMKTATVSI